MTTTTAINAQSIGTSTNKGEGLFSQKITAQSDTSGYFVSPEITNGATGDYDSKQVVRIWFSSSAYSYTAANAVSSLKQDASYVDVRPGRHAADITANNSFLSVLAGAYIYLWCDIPTVTTAQTLTVKVTEI